MIGRFLIELAQTAMIPAVLRSWLFFTIFSNIAFQAKQLILGGACKTTPLSQEKSH